MSKNLKSILLVILFPSTLGLGSTPFVLYINLLWHFCAFLVKLGDLCLSFFLSPLVDFFFFFIVAQLHACVVCISLLAGLAVVPPLGFLFCFCYFFFVVVFRKQHALALRG